MSTWRTVMMWSVANAIQVYSATDFSTLQQSYQELLQAQVPDFQKFFSIIYSYVLMISILLSFTFSFLCTKYGAFKPMIGLFCITNIAQFAIFQGVAKQNASIIFIARIIYNSSAFQNVIMTGVYIAKRFEKNEKSFPSSIIAILTIYFACLNNAVAPMIVEKYGLLMNNFFLILINFLSLIIIIISVYLEQRDKHQDFLKFMQQQKEISPPGSPARAEFLYPIKDKEISYMEILQELPPKFYLLTIIISAQFLFSLLFQIIGNKYLQQRYDMTQSKAGQTMSAQGLLIFTLPFVGKIIDKYSEKSEILTIAASFLSIISGIMITQIQPLFGLILLGSFNCLRITIVFPLLSRHTACKKTIGVWYGLVKIIENFLGCVIFFIAGDIYQLYGNYNAIVQICIYIAGIGALTSIIFWAKYSSKKGIEIVIDSIDDLETNKNPRKISKVYSFDSVKESSEPYSQNNK